MPALAQHRRDIILNVFGSNMPSDYYKFETINVKVFGHANNLDNVYYKARILVAPLLSGAVIKGKVHEPMSYGLPVIATDFAAEGISLSNGVSTLTTNMHEEWVESILLLCDN